MVSTRWLLVLMLWMLPWLQMVKSGFSVQRFANVANWNPSVIIPKDGVYLISVIVDPFLGCNLTLRLYCKCHGKERYFFSAYSDAIYSHAEMATGLKKYDKLFLKKYGEIIEAASSFSVVYVAELNSFYISMKNGIFPSYGSPIWYATRLTPNGWSQTRPTKMRFYMPTTGIYWVTVRPKPHRDPIMKVRRGSKVVLTAYAEKLKTVSASGAFRPAARSAIITLTQGGPVYSSNTLLSIVYLAGNKKPNTYPFEHLAFTAELGWTRRVVAHEVPQFKRVLTDYGSMYVDGYTEIRRTGSYMVSIRPDPESTILVIVTLFVDGRFYWAIYAEEGVPVGATISLFLQLGSYLEVRSSNVSTLGSGTMFSVAFIQP